MLRRSIAFLATLVLLFAISGSAVAGDPPTRVQVLFKERISAKAGCKTKAISQGVQANSEIDGLFDELETLEDPSLEDHKAGDLSNNEVIIVIVCLIIFFPLGIILLIVYLADDD